MEEKPVAPKKQSESRYDYVIAFLAIEAIVLVCFGFAGTNGLIFLRAIGLCLSLFLFPFAQRMFAKQKANKKLYYPLIPVGVTMLLLCFSLFWFKLYGSAAFTAFFDGLLVFLGLSGFFLLALGLKSIPWMKLEYILLGVLTGLALAVFITMFYSVIRYGFFYAARFKSLVYYYDGVVFHIDSEAKFLDGFKFREVSLDFAKWGGFTLASSGAGLFANSIRKNKRNFAVLAAFALLGIIDLAIVPFIKGLILLVIVYVFGAVIAYLMRLKEVSQRWRERLNKIMPIVFYALIGVVVLGLLVLFIDVYLGHDKSFLAKIPKIGGQFASESGIGYQLEEMISQTLFPVTSTGRKFDFASAMFGMGSANHYYGTAFFEFNLIWENGLLAFVGTLYCIFYFMKKIRVYLHDDTQGSLDKKLVVAMMILGIFLYFSFCSDEMPLRHPEGLQEPFSNHSTTLLAFPRSNAFILLFFLLGLVFSVDPKYRGAAEEIKPEGEPTEVREATLDE